MCGNDEECKCGWGAMRGRRRMRPLKKHIVYKMIIAQPLQPLQPVHPALHPV